MIVMCFEANSPFYKADSARRALVVPVEEAKRPPDDLVIATKNEKP